MKKKSNLAALFYKHNKGNFIVAVVSIILMSILNVGIAFILQKIIDTGVSHDLEALINVIIVTGLLLVCYLVVGIVSTVSRSKFKERALVNYKQETIHSLISKDLRSFRKVNTGNYLSIFNNDLKLIEVDYLEGSILIVQQIALFLFGLAAMIYIDVRITCIVVLLGTLPIAVSVCFSKTITSSQAKVSRKNGLFTTTIKELFLGITVIKSFHIEKEVIENITHLNSGLEGEKKKYNNKVNIVKVISEVCGFLVIIAIFALSIFLVMKGELTLGSTIAFVQLLNYLLGPIEVLGDLANKRKASKGLLENIDNIIMENEEEKTIEVNKKDFNEQIVFKDVSFAYDEQNNVLKNINVKFEKGKSYAIVGFSGSGKSTLINLLMSYYDNYTGQIYMDNQEIRKIPSSDLADLMAVIQQDVYMFDDSLKNNIKLYKDYEDEELTKVIGMANLDRIVTDKGIDYRCGENGTLLSGGEKQRVSIARALIKKTPIILLDEATAALDNTTAFEIENTILNLKESTRIIVTHKLNELLLSKYDEIIMLKDGRVIENGSFKELIDKKGEFYSLYNISKVSDEKAS